MAVHKTLGFKEAKEVAEKERQPMDDGVCKLRCAEVIEGNTKTGRPNARFILEVVDNANPDYNGKKINHFITIATPQDPSGIGFMVDMAEGFKNPWGEKGFDPQSFIGKMCRANVVVDDIYNKVKSFI